MEWYFVNIKCAASLKDNIDISDFIKYLDSFLSDFLTEQIRDFMKLLSG